MLYVYDVGFAVGDAIVSEVAVDQNVVVVRSLPMMLKSCFVNTSEKNLWSLKNERSSMKIDEERLRKNKKERVTG